MMNARLWLLAIGLSLMGVVATRGDVLHLNSGTTVNGSLTGYQNLTVEFSTDSGTVQRYPLAQIKLIESDSRPVTIETRMQGKLEGQLQSFQNGAFTVKTADGRTQNVQAVLITSLQTAGSGTSKEAVALISRGQEVDLEKHLVKGKVTIVDFYADWCGPCRRISPYLEKLAQEDADVVLRKIDLVDWRSPVAKQFRIQSIPEIRVYNRTGNLVGTVKGADSAGVDRLVARAK